METMMYNRNQNVAEEGHCKVVFCMYDIRILLVCINISNFILLRVFLAVDYQQKLSSRRQPRYSTQLYCLMERS